MNPFSERHCCPHCGHYVGWKRIYLGLPYSIWNCESCGIRLTGSTGSRWLIGVTSPLWVVGITLSSTHHVIDGRGVIFLALMGWGIAVNLLKVVIVL